MYVCYTYVGINSLHEKNSFGLFIGLVISYCYNFIDSIINTCEKIPVQNAFVTIKNESNCNIKMATLIHEDGKATISNVEKGDVAFIGFDNESENSYILSVQLDNDSILQTRANYFELGFRPIEIIQDSIIMMFRKICNQAGINQFYVLKYFSHNKCYTLR